MHRHPDQAFSAFVYDSFKQGFHIGFNRHKLNSCRCNHPSYISNNSVVSSHITLRLDRGCLIGPLSPSEAHLVHVSPIGLVPKPHSDKFRMIVDLSAPKNASVSSAPSSMPP